ncbi:MAG: tetratricopeptide repeat protein, partial [Verrucomicrobiae bacterium]|nr:tetratricopeptide repeat protein [Verrucomicrobiae bacterium]
NGLLTKVIFDKNPDHEFYIEESFPLKWMHPHLVPYGIIMKIERNPVAELSAEMLAENHAYWSQYAQRFIGDWITYDTPTSEVADFALRTYLRRDLTGFKGDPKFVRDKQAQKAFSKLRNAQGKSIFGWRAQRVMDRPELQQRYLREAEFALKQAFAFCPYSPETVFNYASLLAGMGRYDDAARVASTCVTFDPDNAGVRDLLRQLEGLRDSAPPAALDLKGLKDTERQFRAQPTNVDLGFRLASSYFQTSRSNEAMSVLEEMLTNAASDTRTLISLAQAFQTINRIDKMEDALRRFAQKMPESPEAWFDLAAILAAQNKMTEAQTHLTTAVRLSDARRAQDPKARDLRDLYKSDPRFEPGRGQLQLP